MAVHQLPFELIAALAFVAAIWFLSNVESPMDVCQSSHSHDVCFQTLTR